MKFLKGMGTGLIVGACIGMTVVCDSRMCRRRVKSAVRTVETFLADLSNSLKF